MAAMIKEIKKYFDDILIPQLTDIGVSDTYLGATVDVIYRQMYSVLVNWDDQDFINTLFLTVSEEAPFYMPKAKTETKSFVVLTIRNSPIESLQSDSFHNAGIAKKISDKQLIEITSKAIEYFDKLNFSELAIEEEYVLEYDVYYSLSEEYPIAWNVLKSAANGSSQSSSFDGFVYKNTPEHLKLDMRTIAKSTPRRSVLDGYDPAFDEALITQLTYIVQDEGAFFTDCFKMLSRNMKKVLHVVEILMQHQCSFITSNYYIENGYFDKRSPIIQAAPSSSGLSGMERNYRNFTGVLPKHKVYMQMAFKA